MRVFCTATELNTHKQSPCEQSSVKQNDPIMIQSVVANSEIKSRINQSITMDAIAHSSHSEFVSVTSQMDRLNASFSRQKEVNRSPFECEICGRVFNKKYNMIKHKIIHTDERPFECFLCHKM